VAEVEEEVYSQKGPATKVTLISEESEDCAYMISYTEYQDARRYYTDELIDDAQEEIELSFAIDDIVSSEDIMDYGDIVGRNLKLRSSIMDISIDYRLISEGDRIYHLYVMSQGEFADSEKVAHFMDSFNAQPIIPHEMPSPVK